jgi:hypothetical protein
MTKVNGTGANNILSSDLDGVGVTWRCRAQPFGSITAKAEENLEIEDNNCGLRQFTSKVNFIQHWRIDYIFLLIKLFNDFTR